MQLLLDFLEETAIPSGTPPIWAVLNDNQKVEVSAALARVIAKVGTQGGQDPAQETEGRKDEEVP